MAIKLAGRLIEDYKTIFGTLGEADRIRIAILEEIADNETRINGKKQTIEQALAQAEKENQQSLKSATLRALYSLRQWYEKPGEEIRKEAIDYLIETGSELIIENLTDCLKVLRMDRIKTLRAALNNAFDITDQIVKCKAIHATAETLVHTEIPELINYAIEIVGEYQKEIKQDLDNARDEFMFAYATSVLLGSQVPHLVEYAKKINSERNKKIIATKAYASQQESHAI